MARTQSRLRVVFLVVAVAFACVLPAPGAHAQELEPRLLSNLPVGAQFLIGAYAFAHGNILLDPSIPIDDLNADLHTFAAGYLRAINLFGQSARIDFVVPYAVGDWSGKLEGEPGATSREGFGDARIRFATHFTGAPALDEPDAIRSYRQDLIVGSSLQIILPTGQYDASRLINLGSNRWAFRGTFGASKRKGSWLLEGYAVAWVFTRNDDFLSGQTKDQQPLWVMKVHAVRTMRQGRWFSIGVGYALGGRTTVNGVDMDTRISTLRLGGSFTWPVSTRQSLKFGLVSGVRFEKGADFDAVSAAYQFRWGGIP